MRDVGAAPAAPAASAVLPLDAGQGLATDRLVLRRVSPGDIHWIERLNADPEVMQYLGGPETAQETRTMLRERIFEYYDAHPGLGLWVTMLKSSGEPVGLHLLNHIRGTDLVQVGYRLFASHWGRGYATEMARALVGYGFATKGLDAIHGIASVDNLASRRALEKAGLAYRGERAFAHPSYLKFSPLAYYAVTASEHAARGAAEPFPIA